MINEGITIDALIAGAQMGISLAVSAAMVTSRLPVSVKVCGALAASAFGLNYLANSPAGELIEKIPPLWLVVCVFSATAGGLIWVMVVAVFDDKPVRPMLFIPAAMLALAALVLVTSDGGVASVAWWAANLLALLIFLHALYLLARGHAGDIVESRRRLRRPLVWTCAALAAAEVLVLVFAQGRAQESVTRTLAFVEMLAFVLLAGALFELRRTVFAPSPARQNREDTDGHLAADLNRIMDEQEPWREEGLSIGALAERLSVPEHRLRRLINGRLGHSNFPSFINGYRIEAAKRRLDDPAGKDRPIAEIAFDLGFTSLSPFNRAFKEATGQTPTAWRRRPPHDENG